MGWWVARSPALRPSATPFRGPLRLFGKNFDLDFGSKGANQAVAAWLCGADVVMVARVASDLFGEATLKNLAAFGIDTTHVTIVPGAPTGVAPIFVEPSGQNRIIVVKGANDHLRAEDVDAAASLLCGVDTIILQFEIPVETVYQTVRFAKRHGVRCFVNPEPAGEGGRRCRSKNCPADAGIDADVLVRFLVRD